MKMKVIYQLIAVVVSIFVVTAYLAPLLVPLFPPYGAVIIILLYLVIVGYMLGWGFSQV